METNEFEGGMGVEGEVCRSCDRWWRKGRGCDTRLGKGRREGKRGVSGMGRVNGFNIWVERREVVGKREMRV